ncbi:MAG: hypothetical protein Ct9H300mP28_13570 [Pseudomonadota bacterium]|nr:MAG: hypothetical protein CM1200mP28_13560 [Deltaproteobacteria bacterium]GIT71543.1 MAG: hypothetical protein Ct9H300mP28_13570 [Pseudomonadota bacterium]
MLEAMEMTLAVAEKFPDLEFVDFGGGFGFHTDIIRRLWI